MKSVRTSNESPYSLHPGFAREAAYRRNLKEHTGKSLEEWVAATCAQGPKTAKERIGWLKAANGFTTDYATWVAVACEHDTGAAAYDPDALVHAMFVRKARLFPIYEGLLARCLALGPDVKACPCGTIVPIYRNHVIAQLKPSTNTRIDLGFALGGPAATRPTARLLDTGGFAKKDRITHRVAVTSLAEIDRDVGRWLEAAYSRDA